MSKKILPAAIFTFMVFLLLAHGHPAPFMADTRRWQFFEPSEAETSVFIDRREFADTNVLTRILLLSRLGWDYFFYRSCALFSLYLLTGKNIWEIITDLERLGAKWGVKSDVLFGVGTPTAIVRDYLFSLGYKITSTRHTSDNPAHIGGRVIPSSLNELLSSYKNAYVHIKKFQPGAPGHAFVIHEGKIYDSWEAYKEIAFSRQPEKGKNYYIEAIYH